MIRTRKRLLCHALDGAVHVVTATYWSACDTLCGHDVTPVHSFWTEGDPKLPPRGPTCARCIECMYAQETPMQRLET